MCDNCEKDIVYDSKLNEVNYEDFVSQRIKPGASIVEDVTAESMNLLHMAIGIAGEAGELLDAIKKHVVYNKKLDKANVIEELGDLEFYMQGLRSQLGLMRFEVLSANVDKLSKRYKTQYTDKQAQERADKKGG